MIRMLAFLVATMAWPVAADSESDRILAVYADWRAAVQTADIPRYVNVLAEDVRLIPPGADVIAGSAGYGDFLVPVFEAADYRIEVVGEPLVDVMGDIAVAEYEYIIHLTLKDPDQGVAQAGALTASRTHARYLDVLRLQQGEWKIWRHTWQNM